VRGRALSDLVVASRPLSWVNTALPFVAAAYDVERGLTPLIVLGALYFLVPFNLLMYGVNDVYDYASDLANPRKGSLEGGLLPPDRRRLTWSAIAITNVPLLVVLAILAPAAGTVAVLSAVVAAVIYSAPPLRTKERPFADSVTSALHFVLPAAAGFLVAGLPAGELPWLILGGFLAWGIASHALGAIQDIAYDRAAGIGSIASALGARPTAVVAMAGYGIAVVAALALGGLAVAAAAVLALYLLLPLGILLSPTEAQARRSWRSFLSLNLLAGFVITLVLLRHWGLSATTAQELLAGTAVAAAAISLLQVLANEIVLGRARTRGRGTGEGGSSRRDAERRHTGAGEAGARTPSRLTVVVPCRDEAARLPGVIAALAAQDHRALEIIVVDDGSTDGSADVARRELATNRPAAGHDRVIDAGPKPPGWSGKSWACAAGFREAATDRVLFLDADTIPAPPACRILAEVSERTGAGLVSGVSTFAMPTAREQIGLSGFVMAIFGFLPLWLLDLASGRPSSIAFGYGPLLLVERGAYERSGGHGASPASQREDIDLARTFARAGESIRLVRAADLAVTRHYPAGWGALRAWRRLGLAYAGGSYTGLIATVAWELASWLLPIVVPVLGLLLADAYLTQAGLVALGLLIAFRVVLGAAERQPPAAILWHPVTAVATIAFQLLSLVDGLRGIAPIWRGRPLEEQVP